MKQFPASKSELFWSFTWLALQGFGGVLPVAQRELVDKKRWYTQEEFLEDWAVAQVLPGPNVVNLAIIFGSRYFGWPGAIAGIAGMLIFPMLVLVAVALALALVMQALHANVHSRVRERLFGPFVHDEQPQLPLSFLEMLVDCQP